MNRVLRVVIYGVLLILGPTSVLLLTPATVRYRIEERYEIAADRPGEIRLAVMVPNSGAYQRVEHLTVDWMGEERRESHEAVEVLMLSGASDGDGSATASIAYDVALRQGRIRWEAEVRVEDLAPQDGIESDAPTLMAQTDELCAGRPAEDAYRVYGFTADHLAWPEGTRAGDEPSALQAYETGVGVCGEFANLMTALCRACEIPARSITGLSLPMLLPPPFRQTRTWMHPGGSHAWVEVYAGEMWHFADPSWASNLPFDRLWFGRAFGQYLSYGEQAEHDRIYEEMIAWTEAGGEIIGAMSAPLKFAASHSVTEATVEPTASVQKTVDMRLIGAAGVYLAIVGGAGIIEAYHRKVKRETSGERARKTPQATDGDEVQT